MPKLIIERGDGKGEETVQLSRQKCVMGRSAENMIFLDDHRASRQHAEIFRENGDYFIRDLNSKNGTFLNGERLIHPVILKTGDKIGIGKTMIVFDPHGASDVEVVSREAKAVATLPVQPGETLIAGQFDKAVPETYSDPLNRLKIVYQFADQLRKCFEFQAVTDLLLDTVFEVLKPDRGAVLLMNPENRELEPAASRSTAPRDPDKDEKILISQSITSQCIHDRLAVSVLDAAQDARFSAKQSILMSNIHSAICCPLIAGDTIHGVLYLDTTSDVKEFSRVEMELVTGLANQTALAMGNILHHQEQLRHRELELQLNVARRIHDHLLRHHEYENEWMIACGWNNPSSEVGGDYFGFFELDSGPLIAIGDGTGHGVGAALVMSTARAYLVGTLASGQPEIATLMGTLNELLVEDLDPEMFISFNMVRLGSPGRKLCYCSAGHEPPLLFRSSEGKFIDLQPGGIALGIMKDFQYQEGCPLDLKSGDRVLLYTDGIVEQQNEDGEEFGLRRLKHALTCYGELPAAKAVPRIASAVDKWRGGREQTDDHTLVLIGIK